MAGPLLRRYADATVPACSTFDQNSHPKFREPVMRNRMGRRPVPLVPFHPNHFHVRKVRKLLIVLRLLSLGRHRRRLHIMTHQMCEVIEVWIDFSRDPLLSPALWRSSCSSVARMSARKQLPQGQTHSVCAGHFQILTYTQKAYHSNIFT